MEQFKVGQSYSTRSACDYDCIITVTIDRRTAKTVSAKVRGESKTFRLAEVDGAESIRPWGSFSMAPMITAKDAD